jgi:SNF2 family DNA or RNA helicase
MTEIENISGIEIVCSDAVNGFLSHTPERSSAIETTEISSILRDYQKAGLNWLGTIYKYSFGGVLADDMGLGKTIQILSLLLSVGNSKSIVVCPSTLLLNWQNEIIKFAPSLKALIVSGNKGARIKKIETVAEYDLVITSYDTLKRDIDLYEQIPFDCCILDEAQHIKNVSTQIKKVVGQLKSRCRFALTGTPIENNLSELWSIFDFVMPRYLNTYAWFKRTYSDEIEKCGNHALSVKLEKIVSPFILRRLKTGVLKELPSKTEHIIEIPLTGKQRIVYEHREEYSRAVIAAIDANEEESFNKEKFQILMSLFVRLRQLCCHPPLFLNDYEGNSGKLLYCITLIEDLLTKGHRIALFSQFAEMLAVIEQHLVSKEIEYFKLTGKTKKEERVQMVEDFNNSTVPVFLLSLKAGGTGLNLTGADVVIHYDPWWNMSVENQATDRTYRIGQRKPVTVYKLVMQNTIEEKIIEIQQRKIDLADSIIKKNDGIINKMTRAEILGLLTDSMI